MNGRWGRIWRVFLALYLVAIHAALAFFAVSFFFPNVFVIRNTPIPAVEVPISPTPAPTPLPVPSQFADELPSPSPEASAVPPTDLPQDVLMIPVKGIKRSQLVDTFTSARANGRAHDAIDIMAPGGAPVLAAADGEIVKFFDSVNGGTTIYEMSDDRKYIYYYAHLMRRADDLHEHDHVTRGRVIAYVGDTGDAGAGNYHLHFSIAIAQGPKSWWKGTYINPYPILLKGIETP
ncbi:MAG TPA: peptidoglycan DD-metalloendopeptidase family protein [Pyrinomonadaceae bacterium]|jgi:murein DD-endopeptidase MepM/ murein hydrolase activator NlpD